MSALPKLFTKDGCADSLRARTWLVEHGVAFAECNIEREPELASEALGMRVTAAPLLVTERGAVFGYRPIAYGESLPVAVRPAVPAPILRVGT